MEIFKNRLIFKSGHNSKLFSRNQLNDLCSLNYEALCIIIIIIIIIIFIGCELSEENISSH